MSEKTAPHAPPADEADERTWTEDERQAQRVFNASLLLTLPVIAAIMFFTGGFTLLTGLRGADYYEDGKFEEHATNYQIAHWLPVGPGGVYVFGGFEAGKKRSAVTNWLPAGMAGLSLLAFVVACRAASYVITHRGRWRYKLLIAAALLLGLAELSFSAALIFDLVFCCSWPIEHAVAGLGTAFL